MINGCHAFLSSGNVYRPGTANAAVMEGLMLGHGLPGLSFRVVSLQDNGHEDRKAWLRQGGLAVQEDIHHEGEASLLSMIERDCDVLIVAGNDVVRMKRIVTQTGLALRPKLKICLTNQSVPSKRALLLMAGYDDVIDIARMSWPEFSARVWAMYGRIVSSMDQQHAKEHEHSRLMQVCNPHKLTEREQEMLLMMLNAKQNIAPSLALRRCISKPGDLTSEFNLRVKISQLRRKLFDHVEISNVRGVGYQLIVHPREAGI